MRRGRLVRVVRFGILGAGIAVGCASFDPSEPAVDLPDGALDGARTLPETGTDAASPVTDSGALRALKVAAGPHHTCAIFEGGRLKCWGANAIGSLGLGDTIDRGAGADGGALGAALPFVDVGAGRRVVDVSLGGDSDLDDAGAAPYLSACVVLDDGSIKCWGWNQFGQLGRGSNQNVGAGPNQMGENLAPVNVGTTSPATAIAVGTHHACGLFADGSVRCWGQGTYGELGNGSAATVGISPGQMGDALRPVDLGSGKKAKAISAAAHFSCALLLDGSVKCWGINSVGQLGLGDTFQRGTDGGSMGDALPVVNLGDLASAISSGFYQTCAVLSDARVKCWGFNSKGQLGVGDLINRGSGEDGGAMGAALARLDLGTDGTVTHVSVGSNCACALRTNRTVACWGVNKDGVLGTDDDRSRGAVPSEMGSNLKPVPIPNVEHLSVGDSHACVVTDGRVKCWGTNSQGQLGLGDRAARGQEPGDMGGLPFAELF